MEAAAGIGLKRSEQLVFGIVDGVNLAGFGESLKIFDGLPRLRVLDLPEDRFYSNSSTSAEKVEDLEALLTSILSGERPAQEPLSGYMPLVMKTWWLIRHKGGFWSWLLLIPAGGILYILFDSPQAQERREARRAEKQAAAEALRLKNN